MKYPAKFTNNDSGSVDVTFRDFPILNLCDQDALGACLQACAALPRRIEHLMRDNMQVPAPSKLQEGEQFIALTPEMSERVQKHNASLVGYASGVKVTVGVCSQIGAGWGDSGVGRLNPSTGGGVLSQAGLQQSAFNKTIRNAQFNDVIGGLVAKSAAGTTTSVFRTLDPQMLRIAALQAAVTSLPGINAEGVLARAGAYLAWLQK